MAPDEPKEMMTREEIDAHIDSVSAKEERENPENQTVQPQTTTEKAQDMPSPADNEGAVSQSEIDAMLAQQSEPQPEPEGDEKKSPSEMAQNDIDAMIAQEQKQEQGGSTEESLQRELDNVFAKQQSEVPADDQKDIWDGLGRDILSQDEIDALLSGFDAGGNKPAQTFDAVIAGQEKELPGPVDDIVVISRQEHIERQRKKEENIFREKRRASALIKKLMRLEQKRINRVIARKNKMVNEDLYARYEITRADGSKMIVSMSEKAAVEYRSFHPGCCIYRI